MQRLKKSDGASNGKLNKLIVGLAIGTVAGVFALAAILFTAGDSDDSEPQTTNAPGMGNQKFEEDSLKKIGLLCKKIDVATELDALIPKAVKSDGLNLFKLYESNQARQDDLNRVAWCADGSVLIYSHVCPATQKREYLFQPMLLKIELNSMKLVAALAFPAPLRDMVMTRDGLAMLLSDHELGGGLIVVDESTLDPRCIWQCEGDHIAGSRNSNVVYVSDGDQLQVIDTVRGRRMRRTTFHDLGTGSMPGQTTSAEFTELQQLILTPDSSTLLAAGRSGMQSRISRYTVSGPVIECQQTLPFKTERNTVCFSTSGNHFLIPSARGFIFSSGNLNVPIGDIQRNFDNTTTVSLSNDARSVVSMRDNGGTFIDSNGSRKLSVFGAKNVHQSPDGRIAVVVARSSVWGLKLNSAPGGSVFPKLPDQVPQAKLPAAVDEKKTSQYSPRQYTPRMTFFGYKPSWFGWDPDGKSFCTVTTDYGTGQPKTMLRRIDVATRKILAEAAFSPRDVQASDGVLLLKSCPTGRTSRSTTTVLVARETFAPIWAVSDQLVRDIHINGTTVTATFQGQSLVADLKTLKVTAKASPFVAEQGLTAKSTDTAPQIVRAPGALTVSMIAGVAANGDVLVSGVPFSLNEVTIGAGFRRKKSPTLAMTNPVNPNLVLIAATPFSKRFELLPFSVSRSTPESMLLLDLKQPAGNFPNAQAAAAANSGSRGSSRLERDVRKWIDETRKSASKHLANGTVSDDSRQPIQKMSLAKLRKVVSGELRLNEPYNVLSVVVNDDFSALTKATRVDVAKALLDQWKSVHPADKRDDRKIRLVFSNGKVVGGSQQDGVEKPWGLDTEAIAALEEQPAKQPAKTEAKPSPNAAPAQMIAGTNMRWTDRKISTSSAVQDPAGRFAISGVNLYDRSTTVENRKLGLTPPRARGGGFSRNGPPPGGMVLKHRPRGFLENGKWIVANKFWNNPIRIEHDQIFANPATLCIISTNSFETVFEIEIENHVLGNPTLAQAPGAPSRWQEPGIHHLGNSRGGAVDASRRLPGRKIVAVGSTTKVT